MTTINEALRTHLINDVDVSAIVGDRVLHEWMPQDVEYPAISFTLTSTERFDALDGPLSLLTSSFSVDCWAFSTNAVKDLAAKVKTSLDGVSGAFGGLTAQHVMVEGEGDLSTVDGDREDRRVSFDVSVVYVG